MEEKIKLQAGRQAGSERKCINQWLMSSERNKNKLMKGNGGEEEEEEVDE